MHTLDYAAATRVVAAAVDAAAALPLPITVAVLDHTREVKALGRMDGAPTLTAEVAVAKAFTACSLGVGTHQTQAFTGHDGPFRGLEVLGGGRLCTIPGGLPLVRDGLVVAAVAVSGGSAEQDLQLAEVALAALEQEVTA